VKRKYIMQEKHRRFIEQVLDDKGKNPLYMKQMLMIEFELEGFKALQIIREWGEMMKAERQEKDRLEEERYRKEVER